MRKFTKKIYKNGRYIICAVLALLILASSISAGHLTAQATGTSDDIELSALANGRSIMALVYLCEETDVRNQASMDSDVTATVTSGQTVFIRDAAYNEEEGILWIYVEFSENGESRGGYIPRNLLACSDERFLAWEKKFFQKEGNSSVQPIIGGGTLLFSVDGGVTEDVAQFPESYQAELMGLKKLHPNWIFVPMNTDLDWNTVISNELTGGKSLVYKTFPDYTKNGAYDDGQWFYATRGILEYYMDPRNMLTDDRIFQFELLTYNETYHTEQAVETFLQNTFMRSPDKAPGTVMTYAHIFWAIGREEGREISPFHLASRVYQEQGQGNSPLISGTYPGYEGYYNYFNVGASGTTTTQVIESGLKYAKEHNWNNAYYSILGGADTISTNYIKKGQDTLYLQKYNVNPKGGYPLYTHQYMQNISAPTTEASSIRKLYVSAGSLNSEFVFKIPVYKNMPAQACPYPQNPATIVETTDITLKIDDVYDKTVWVDGVPYTPTADGADYTVNLPDKKAKSAVVYSYDSDGVPTGMYVWTLTRENGAYVATAQEGLKDLITYQGSSLRVSGDPGIRVKMEIPDDIKTKLTDSGVDGYRLKECGSLATDIQNPESNPFVKGKKGIVAQTQSTYVLTSISPSRYNTEFAFRGYVVLTKNGTDTIVYGPIVKKSMVSLANQALEAETYAEGSAEDAYLKEILEDAKQ